MNSEDLLKIVSGEFQKVSKEHTNMIKSFETVASQHDEMLNAFKNVEKQHDTMNKEISEIKSMLRQLLSK